MPFDGVPAKPSLQVLSDVLRDRSRWPVWLVWDYCDPRTCGIGLARAMWPYDAALSRAISSGGAFGLSKEHAEAIFYNCDVPLGKTMSAVTPEDVADAIDAHLAGVGCERDRAA